MSGCVRGAVTRKQAYELVVQLLASDPQPILPSGVLPADLVRLRQQPRPCSRSTSRQRSPKRRPTTGPPSGPCLRPPLGTVPLSPYATVSSRAQDHARRPFQPPYHEVASACYPCMG